MSSNREFVNFIREAAALLNMPIDNDLLDKIHTYFNRADNIKNYPKWKIIRLMNQYGFTTRDILNAAVRRFTEKYGFYSDGRVGYNPEYKRQLEQQHIKKDFEQVMNELNQRVENERQIEMREHFHNVMNEIEAKREAVREILKPIPQAENDLTKEQEFINILHDNAKLQNGVEIEFKNNKNVTKRVRFSVLKQPIIDFLDHIQDYSKWYFKFSINVQGKDKWTTIPLNDEGIRRVHDMLTQDLFGEAFKNSFNNRIMNEDKADDNRIIECSDSAVAQYGIQDFTMDMVNKIQITSKPYLYKEAESKLYCDTAGAFFNRRLIDDCPKNIENLCKRYQIFKGVLDPETNKPRKEYEMNCLMYALTMSGQFSEEMLSVMKTRCLTRVIARKDLIKFCEEFSIKVNLRKYTHEQKKWRDIIYIGPKDAKYNISLGLINKHYFLDEVIEGVSSYYLINHKTIHACEKIKNKPVEWKQKIIRIKNGNYEINNKVAHISSRDLVQYVDEHLSIQMTFSEKGIMQTDLYKYITDDLQELYVNEADAKVIKPKQKKENEVSSVYYADCESDVVSSNTHQVYCISFIERNEEKPHCIFGDDCISKFFDIVPNNSIIYFHNLGYDARLMSSFNINSAIDKNSKIITETISYKGKEIKLKDSYSLLSMPLAKFPTAFGLKCGEKEMFPYKYYTIERLKTNKGIICEAGKDENKTTWNQHQFESNLKKINADNGDGTFDMKKYAEFYCNQDVIILQQGFNKFRQLALEDPINLDVDEFVTAPSIANQYFTDHIYTNGKMYAYSGVARAFIQQAIYGGRCMLRDNLKWHITKTLNDFDAVSLYPSAMKRLYTVSGTPSILNKHQCSVDYLMKHTADADSQVDNEHPISSYIVDIEITKVGIDRHFPLIVYRDAKTNTNRNENACVKMTVDNITLEDLIKYQGIECNIIRGIYWVGEKDFKIRDEIQKLHELRCKYKATKNPMQEIIKLIMNSAYGKCIQKPIDKTVHYCQVQTYKKYIRKYDKNGKETPLSKKRFEQHKDRIKKDANGVEYILLQEMPANKFLEKNHAKINKAYDINKNLVAIEVNKQIDDFYSNTLIGVQILSMSKRIMNEVMCTAEDNDINIFYQDTDSMHIENDKIPLLAKAFKERFGRELIGKELGQFHNDFDELESNPVSVESYFLGKKAYIDKLSNDNNEEAYHYRMKGVDLKCIQLKAKKQFKGDIMKLYNHLYEGNGLKFDLTETKARFKMNNNRTVSNVKEFTRCVRFTSPVGKL